MRQIDNRGTMCVHMRQVSVTLSSTHSCSTFVFEHALSSRDVILELVCKRIADRIVFVM